jgi:hypothetical protein
MYRFIYPGLFINQATSTEIAKFTTEFQKIDTNKLPYRKSHLKVPCFSTKICLVRENMTKLLPKRRTFPLVSVI